MTKESETWQHARAPLPTAGQLKFHSIHNDLRCHVTVMEQS